MAGGKFVCDDCEYKRLAFDKVHTKMHTLVRVSEKVEEVELSMEERLRLVENELGRMREVLAKLVEKGLERSLNDPLMKGDIQAAVTETKAARSVPEEEVGMMENS